MAKKEREKEEIKKMAKQGKEFRENVNEQIEYQAIKISLQCGAIRFVLM